VDSWALTHYARPWSINVERRWHPHKRAAYVKEWRQAFYHLAHTYKLPTPVPRPVSIAVCVALKGKRTMDAGNYFPCVKAAVDGLVDAGVLPDDTPTWVKSYTLHSPVNRLPTDMLTLIVTLAEWEERRGDIDLYPYGPTPNK
jgi:Holliday junction resolvase RusA-like endonuclease